MKIEVNDPHKLLSSVRLNVPLNDEQICFALTIIATQRGTWFQHLGSHPDVEQKNMVFFAGRDDLDSPQEKEAKIVMIAETVEDIKLLSRQTAKVSYIDKEQCVFYGIDEGKVPYMPLVYWNAPASSSSPT